jgi:aminomethyltransferase
MEKSNDNKPLKLLPLDAIHRAAGAKMVPFADFNMPLQYQSIKIEHGAVRNKCGLFDVSHMGKIKVEGPGAYNTLQSLLTNDVGRLTDGQIQYSLMCNEDGSVKDDLTVYRLKKDSYLLIVNAATKDTDLKWLQDESSNGTYMEDVSDECALFALQGPKAQMILEWLTRNKEVAVLPYYTFDQIHVAEISSLVARLGYTGEDGFEILCNKTEAVLMWNALLEAGSSVGLMPCGLAVRNILRLEAGMMLYGSDLDQYHTPFEAGLDRFVRFDKPLFVGKSTFYAESELGSHQQLVGFSYQVPSNIPDKCIVYVSGTKKAVGMVTSSALSPTFGGIGMAYIDKEYARNDVSVEILSRNDRRIPATITTQMPFYKRRNFNQKGEVK